MGFLTPLYDLPNHVPEKQRMYQNSTKPIMLRGPRSGLYVGVYGVMFVTGMFATTYSIVSLVKGKAKEA